MPKGGKMRLFAKFGPAFSGPPFSINPNQLRLNFDGEIITAESSRDECIQHVG